MSSPTHVAEASAAKVPVEEDPRPPQAHIKVETDEWVQPLAVDTGVQIRRAPADYAEKVKSRVIANVIYPVNAVHPAPKNFHGDPRLLLRQCTIPYEIVVDRQGMIISYQIDRCHDDLLDAAAEAAILKAQPFPPPPDGAERYRIYATVNFVQPHLLDSKE